MSRGHESIEVEYYCYDEGWDARCKGEKVANELGGKNQLYGGKIYWLMLHAIPSGIIKDRLLTIVD